MGYLASLIICWTPKEPFGNVPRVNRTCYHHNMNQTPTCPEHSTPTLVKWKEWLPPHMQRRSLPLHPLPRQSLQSIQILWAKDKSGASPMTQGGKESNCNAEHTGNTSLIPGWGRSHREGNGNWFQYPCLKIPWMEESGRPQPIGSQRVRHDWVTSLTLSEISQGSPGGSVVENLPDNTGATGVVSSIPGSRRSPGGGNGNPLQYSHLENPMDRGAWWATAHGVTKESDMTQQLNRNNKR